MENNSQMKKILFFFTTGPGAGSERMTVNIANFLDKQKYKIQFVLLGKKDGIISDYIPKEYNPYIVSIRNIWDLTTLKLIKVIKKEKADMVFCSLHFLNCRLIAAAKIVGNVKVIIRGDNTLKGLDKLTTFLVKHTYKYADKIVAQTEELKTEMAVQLGLSDDKIIVLHNYIDTEQIDGKIVGMPNPYNNSDEIRYICTSRCKPEKAQDVLLKAFTIVRRRISNAHLYLLGIYHQEEAYCRQIMDFIHNNDLDNYVHIIGFSDNPFVWIKYANCFLLPSRKEGLPNALIEAMYIGKPVVACECIPIIGRMIENGYNGYSLPVDDVEGLADSMINAINLKNFNMIYKPASKLDYLNLFNF